MKSVRFIKTLCLGSLLLLAAGILWPEAGKAQKQVPPVPEPAWITTAISEGRLRPATWRDQWAWLQALPPDHPKRVDFELGPFFRPGALKITLDDPMPASYVVLKPFPFPEDCPELTSFYIPDWSWFPQGPLSHRTTIYILEDASQVGGGHGVLLFGRAKKDTSAHSIPAWALPAIGAGELRFVPPAELAEMRRQGFLPPSPPEAMPMPERTYQILKPWTPPAAEILSGSGRSLFLLGPGVPAPKGDLGASLILPLTAGGPERARPPRETGEVTPENDEVTAWLEQALKEGRLRPKSWLEAARERGQLRPATWADAAQWLKVPEDRVDKRFPQVMYDAYVILDSSFRLPPESELAGAQSVTLYLAPGVPRPQGNLGHSIILSLADGQCWDQMRISAPDMKKGPCYNLPVRVLPPGAENEPKS